MANDCARCQYQHLEHVDSIRVLQLKPAKVHKDDLHGSLIHMTLSVLSNSLLEPYTALSYVSWAPQ